MSSGVSLDIDAVADYVLTNSLREHPVLTELRRVTANDAMAHTQLAPEVAQLISLLLRFVGARRVIEVGTYTGYSSIAMALALPEDGHIICCDINREWTDVARRFWRRAEVEHKMDLRLGPARDTLTQLIEQHGECSFDAAFIDADKPNYDAYYELCLSLVRPGGLLLIDNVLWSGKVADPDVNDEPTTALRALNAKVHSDRRVDISMLTVADGITIARKR